MKGVVDVDCRTFRNLEGLSGAPLKGFIAPQDEDLKTVPEPKASGGSVSNEDLVKGYYGLSTARLYL